MSSIYLGRHRTYQEIHSVKLLIVRRPIRGLNTKRQLPFSSPPHFYFILESDEAKSAKLTFAFLVEKKHPLSSFEYAQIQIVQN